MKTINLILIMLFPFVGSAQIMPPPPPAPIDDKAIVLFVVGLFLILYNGIKLKRLRNER